MHANYPDLAIILRLLLIYNLDPTMENELTCLKHSWSGLNRSRQAAERNVTFKLQTTVKRVLILDLSS